MTAPSTKSTCKNTPLWRNKNPSSKREAKCQKVAPLMRKKQLRQSSVLNRLPPSRRRKALKRQRKRSWKSQGSWNRIDQVSLAAKKAQSLPRHKALSPALPKREKSLKRSKWSRKRIKRRPLFPPQWERAAQASQKSRRRAIESRSLTR